MTFMRHPLKLQLLGKCYEGEQTDRETEHTHTRAHTHTHFTAPVSVIKQVNMEHENILITQNMHMQRQQT
jgi:hypothetical protein